MTHETLHCENCGATDGGGCGACPTPTPPSVPSQGDSGELDCTPQPWDAEGTVRPGCDPGDGDSTESDGLGEK